MGTGNNSVESSVVAGMSGDGSESRSDAIGGVVSELDSDEVVSDSSTDTSCSGAGVQLPIVSNVLILVYKC